MKKARIGGLITLAKFMTQGSKAAVARDFKLSEDTANRYERLYKFSPWAYVAIRAEAQAAVAAGKDYQYSLDHIIEEGVKAAERAGATVRKAKYHGTGKCLLVDPAKKTATVEDLPSNFSVWKVKREHWAEVEGARIRSQREGLASNRQGRRGSRSAFLQDRRASIQGPSHDHRADQQEARGAGAWRCNQANRIYRLRCSRAEGCPSDCHRPDDGKDQPDTGEGRPSRRRQDQADCPGRTV